MLLFGTETHSAVQPKTENQTLWVEWTGKQPQATQSCVQAWDQHWAWQGSPAAPNCTALWRWQRGLSLSWYSGFFPLIMLFFRSMWPKGSGTQGRGSSSLKLNAVVQHEVIAALDFRAAGEEASLQFLERGKPSGVTHWIVSSVYTGQGALTLLPGLAAQWQSLFVCVHPGHAQLLHCCWAALPSKSSVLLATF